MGIAKRDMEVEVYDDVVILVAMKPNAEIKKKSSKARTSARPGSVLIKYFRNIASADLNALYPDVKVVMSWTDGLYLGVPALAAAVPIVINLASTITVLFVVLGFISVCAAPSRTTR